MQQGSGKFEKKKMLNAGVGALKLEKKKSSDYTDSHQGEQ